MPLLNTTFTAGLVAGETNTFGNVAESESFVHTTASNSTPITNGTASGQATRVIHLKNTASVGGTTWSLTGIGPGLDGTITRDFSRGGTGGAVKVFILENLDATNSITLTQGATVPWTALGGSTYSYTIEPGGVFAIYSPGAGLSVPNNANCNFVVTAVSGTPQYKLTLVGTP